MDVMRVELFDGDGTSAGWTYNDESDDESNPGTSIRINVPICFAATKVKISIPGRTTNLTMREVEVYGSSTVVRIGF